MKKIIVSLIVAVILLPVIAGGSREIIPNLKKDELRIVSLSPNITEIICSLGCIENLVGRTDYCDSPAELSKVQSIGSIDNPNLELIISLKPDVVIASSITDPSILEKINSAGISTYRFFEEYNGLEGAFNLIIETGDAIGKHEQAAEIVEMQKIQLEEIKSKTNTVIDKKKCVYLVSWGEFGDFAATGDSFINDILVCAGGINIASSARFWSISKELLLSEDPQLIFIAENSSSDFKNISPYSHLTGIVHEVDPNIFERQGINSVSCVEKVAKILYPELF